MSNTGAQIKVNDNKMILSNGDIYIGNLINGIKNGK
jgi:hypothetical protein